MRPSFRPRGLESYDVTPDWVLHHLAQPEAEHRSELGQEGQANGLTNEGIEGEGGWANSLTNMGGEGARGIHAPNGAEY